MTFFLIFAGTMFALILLSLIRVIINWKKDMDELRDEGFFD